MSDNWAPIQNAITFRNSQGDNARGTMMKISRTTVVMEVYNPYSIVQLSEVLSDLTIYRGSRAVYEGRAVVNTLVNTGLMLIVSVTLVDTWKDLSGLISDNFAVQEEVAKFLDDFEESKNLDSEFQLVVVKMRSFLDSFNRWLEQADMTYQEEVATSKDAYAEYFESLAVPILPRLDEMFSEFEAIAATIDSEQLMLHKNFAQRNLHPLMLRSPFVHRVYSKPLGYAGDYEMINMIQRNPAEGPSTYACLINTLYVNAPIPRSVQNRTDMLVGYYERLSEKALQESRQFQALSIGCGPALEVRRFLTDPASEGINVNLLDFNETTLGYSHAEIDKVLNENNRKADINYIHESVHKLLKQATGNNAEAAFKDLDFVYCSGLFDYLSTKVCGRLLRLFYQWVRPGGTVLATNMHTSNPNKYSMEYFLEWHLIYRDDKDMEALVPGLGEQNFFTDQTGVNISIEIKKPNVH